MGIAIANIMFVLFFALLIGALVAVWKTKEIRLSLILVGLALVTVVVSSIADRGSAAAIGLAGVLYK